MTASRKQSKKKKVVAVNFRFADDDHRDLVQRASSRKGLSVNAWMVMVTLEQARKQVGEKCVG